MDRDSLIPQLRINTPQINPEVIRSLGKNSHPAVLRDIAEANLANEFFKQLVKRIRDFDASLDETHEVGVRLVSYGQTLVFHLEQIGYSNPSLIMFRGTTDNGEFVEVIQHVTQISILLMRLPLREPEKPKRRIGFINNERLRY